MSTGLDRARVSGVPLAWFRVAPPFQGLFSVARLNWAEHGRSRLPLASLVGRRIERPLQLRLQIRRRQHTIPLAPDGPNADVLTRTINGAISRICHATVPIQNSTGLAPSHDIEKPRRATASPFPGNDGTNVTGGAYGCKRELPAPRPP